MAIIIDFGVTIGNRLKMLVFYAMNTIKTVQMRTCNLAATDVGPGRFPTRRDVYQGYILRICTLSWWLQYFKNCPLNTYFILYNDFITNRLAC